jgi:4'-phosphopantetheinyl transferase
VRGSFEKAMRARPAVFVAAVVGDDLSERLYPVLSAEERQRADRFHFPVDRAAYCSAHYLLRACLSLIAGPKDWRFERCDDGKPYLHPECARDDLQFNLTHSRTRVACAFSIDGPIGVDTEDDYVAPELLEIAARVCSQAELDLLSGLDERSRQSAFARLWTAKEAIAKASGKGLSLDLRKFPIDWTSGTFAGGAGCLGDPRSWKIEHRRSGESHFAAAVHVTSGKAEAILFDWNHVRLADLAASSNGLGWDVEAAVDAKECRGMAGTGFGSAPSAEWSNL